MRLTRCGLLIFAVLSTGVALASGTFTQVEKSSSSLTYYQNSTTTQTFGYVQWVDDDVSTGTPMPLIISFPGIKEHWKSGESDSSNLGRLAKKLPARLFKNAVGDPQGEGVPYPDAAETYMHDYLDGQNVLFLSPQRNSNAQWNEKEVRDVVKWALGLAASGNWDRAADVDPRRVYLVGLSAGSQGIHKFMNEMVEAQKIAGVMVVATRWKVLPSEGDLLGALVPYWALSRESDVYSGEALPDPVHGNGVSQAIYSTNNLASYLNSAAPDVYSVSPITGFRTASYDVASNSWTAFTSAHDVSDTSVVGPKLTLRQNKSGTTNQHDAWMWAYVDEGDTTNGYIGEKTFGWLLSQRKPGGNIGYWPFNYEANLGASTLDWSGQLHAGLLQGSFTLPGDRSTGQDGLDHGALYLNAGRFVEVASTGDLSTLKKNFTVCAWVRPVTDDAVVRGIVTKGDGSSRLFAISVEDKTLRFDYDTNITTYGDADSLTQGTGWHHVAVSVDNGVHVKLYVDGEQQGTTFQANGGVPAAPNAEPLLFGALTGGGSPTGTFKGHVDDVQVFSPALTLAEINDAMSGDL